MTEATVWIHVTQNDGKHTPQIFECEIKVAQVANRIFQDRNLIWLLHFWLFMMMFVRTVFRMNRDSTKKRREASEWKPKWKLVQEIACFWQFDYAWKETPFIKRTVWSWTFVCWFWLNCIRVNAVRRRTRKKSHHTQSDAIGRTYSTKRLCFQFISTEFQ